MALTNAERQKRHKAKLRGNVTGNGVTEGNETVTMPDNWPKQIPFKDLPEVKALWLAINGITERLDKLERPKVVVTPKSITPAAGLSRAIQAKGRMVDNSPMGRMFRGET